MINNMLRKRLASKVIVAILIVSLIPTVFNSLFFYQSASDVIKENVRESSLQIARQAADSLSFIFSNGSDLSDLIYSNEKMQEIVKADLNDRTAPAEVKANEEYMSSFLNSTIYTSSFVRIIYVLKEEGTSWGSGTFSPYKLSMVDVDNTEWAKAAVQKDGELVWGGLQFDQFSGAGENTALVLPVTRVFKDFDNMSNLAYVQVSLDGNAILEKINQITLGKTGLFFVVNDSAEVMIDNDLENIGKTVGNHELRKNILDRKQEFEFEEEGVHRYGVMQPIGNGWSIVGTVPVTEITGEIVSIQRIVIFASVMFGIIAIMLGIAIARRVTEPVNVLTKQMRRVGEGDFSVRTAVNSSDEIGVMSQQFNHMINQVDHLLGRIREEQRQKQEAELRAIKHRINPHFLFNTLSTIRWLLQFNETKRASTALSALSKLLEGNMGKTGSFTSVREEIELVESFMVILQIRYQQNFFLETDFEAGVEDVRIPRMLLQPIVENAIFHGIVPKGEEGTVIISGKKVERGVELKVSDNGLGIREEMLRQFQQTSGKTASYVGIGLSHVYDSVRLYYDEQSKVEITSTEEGTIVKMTLRSKPGGEEHV